MNPYFYDIDIFQKYHYINFGDFDSKLQLGISPKEILAGTGKKSIVIDAASDPWDIDHLKSSIRLVAPCQQISAVLVNSKKIANENQNLNFRFFPVWGIRYTHWFDNFGSNNVSWEEREHLVSCLNRVPHPHRILTYYLINQLSWADKIYMSFYGLSYPNSTKIFNFDIASNLGTNVAKFYELEKSKFPFSQQQNFDWGNCHDMRMPAYSKSFSNILTETSIDNFCPTEKTFKALSAGNLIFPITNVSFFEDMKSLGFDLDYAGLQNIVESSMQKNWVTRIKTLISSLDDLHKNIPEIWHLNKELLTYNRNRLTSKKFEQDILENVCDHL